MAVFFGEAVDNPALEWYNKLEKCLRRVEYAI
jgi:hypothetical protein